MLRSTLLQLLLHSTSLAATISVSTYTTVPSTAAGPTVPTPPAYRMQSLGEGAYLVTDGLYQSLFFVGPESVIAVDAPPTIGGHILKAISSVTTKAVSHVIYSHSHADHIGGAYLYGSEATFVAHRLCAEELALSPDTAHRPAPTITFDSSYTLKVGNQTLQLDYRGPNHEPGNIFIYAPRQKILMLVDIVYPGWIPFNALGEVQNVPGYVKAHDQILTYDFEYYIGGHLNRPGTRRDVVVAREYIHDLLNTSALAVNLSAVSNSSLSATSVIIPTVVDVDGANPWALFNTYIDVLADWVVKEMAARWARELYGYDVYARSHALIMLESVRIDYGILGPFGVASI